MSFILFFKIVIRCYRFFARTFSWINWNPFCPDVNKTILCVPDSYNRCFQLVLILYPKKFAQKNFFRRDDV